VNPRGARSYVRTATFLHAAALVLQAKPDARFKCAALAGDREAARLIETLRIGRSVKLLPRLTEVEMADLLRSAQVVVSPSVHDGTPNSLLEGMACGCVPVAGDLESIREWIVHGKNGLLTDPTNARSLADAILEALANKDLRLGAAGLNRDIILKRAEYTHCMLEVDTFYKRIISTEGLEAVVQFGPPALSRAPDINQEALSRRPELLPQPLA
jgi:glycosyltransferase involved in cell wall biosynthesis